MYEVQWFIYNPCKLIISQVILMLYLHYNKYGSDMCIEAEFLPNNSENKSLFRNYELICFIWKMYRGLMKSTKISTDPI